MAPPAKSNRRSRYEKNPRSGRSRTGPSKERRPRTPQACAAGGAVRETRVAKSRAAANFRETLDDDMGKSPPGQDDPSARPPRPRGPALLFFKVQLNAA